jgi:N-acetylmannosamine-6-phosphate 2-epimerase/N-acetylmannosamine kinase
MNDFTKFHSELRGNVIVSCQAAEGSAFCDPSSMAHFARAAVEGGAAGVRANGPGDIQAIRQAVSVPIIGIGKALQDDGSILITPSFEAAQKLVGAGADMIALDCTRRGQAYGALDRLQRIRADLRVPVLADIATVEEAVQAAGAGADAVLSTMRGYTPETQHVTVLEPPFILELVRAVGVPVIAEGHIWTPRQGRELLDAGAFAIIVGTAITRPDAITRSFVSGLQARHSLGDGCGHFIGIDLGATRTKYGLVSGRGELLYQLTSPTPKNGGRDCLLEHLKAIVAGCLEEAQRRGIKLDAVGVATAGWVDPASGQVVYATDNLPGWTGAAVGSTLRDAGGLPVVVENDANAFAVAEKRFGAARTVADFACITLGTGVGCGCYVGGQLNRGSHFFANALAHIPIQPDGRACTCGLSGCLEAYTNASALLRYAALGNFRSAEEVIAAANSGDPTARNAIQTLAAYLAMGCASIVHSLDPELLILAGGLAQNNPILLNTLVEELAKRVMVWNQRKLRVQASSLGYCGGILGAAAVALDRLTDYNYFSSRKDRSRYGLPAEQR